MATTLNYPDDLRGPLAGRSKTQTSKITQTIPLSGSSYIQKLSTDAPVSYDFSFLFTSPNEALIYLAWVKSNNIDGGVHFNIPLNTEASFGNGGNETQEVWFVPNSGDLLSNVSNNIGIFQYSAKFLCRKEITGLEDYYDLISEGGLYLLQGREILDTALNLDAPEA